MAKWERIFGVSFDLSPGIPSPEERGENGKPCRGNGMNTSPGGEVIPVVQPEGEVTHITARLSLSSGEATEAV